MAVDDHGIEVLKKSGEQVTPGDKSDYYIKVGPTPGHPLEVVESLIDSLVITNLSLPTANAEVLFSLPVNTRRFSIKARGNSTLKISLSSGGTSTLFLTIPAGSSWSEEGLYITSMDFYVAASKDSEVAEVLTWT